MYNVGMSEEWRAGELGVIISAPQSNSFVPRSGGKLPLCEGKAGDIPCVCRYRVNQAGHHVRHWLLSQCSDKGEQIRCPSNKCPN